MVDEEPLCGYTIIKSLLLLLLLLNTNYMTITKLIHEILYISCKLKNNVL